MEFLIKTACIVFFNLFIGIQVSAQTSCSNISNKARINTGSNHVFGRHSFGQSIFADPSCISGNTFSEFSFWAQGNSPTKFDLAIYDGETVTGTPRYTQTSIRMPPANRGGKLTVKLEGGTGNLTFVAGSYYTFIMTIAPSGGGNLIAHTSPDAVNGQAYLKNKFFPNSDLLFEIGTKTDVSSTDDLLTIFYNSYGGKSKFPTHYQEAIETFLHVEDKVKAEEYASAKVMLDQFWAKYPITNSTASNTWESVGTDANGSWTGAPTAYAGLRMLTSIVNHYTNNPYPNYQPHNLNMKVVLVGKTSGNMPTTTSDLPTGTGTPHTSSLDARVSANNYQKLKDVLYVFNQYVFAITDGRLKINVDFIERPLAQFTVGKMEVIKYDHHGMEISGLSDALAGLDPSVKDDADMYWVIYPSFTPGTGIQNQTVASHTAFPGKTFVTGGMDHSVRQPVFYCDDLFFLDRQPKFSKRTYTEVERRSFAPQWFQHEYFHDLYDLFPSFPSEPNGLESVGHIWHKRNEHPWPSDFAGIYEADYFQESMYKRIKLVTDNPIHQRLKMRKEVMPASILNSLTMTDILGNYVNEQATIINGYERGEIIDKGNGVYKWKTVYEQSCDPDLPNGIVKIKNVDYQILLKIDENTGQYQSEVYALKIGNTVFIKQ